MSVYYTADWHLNHENLIKRKARKASSVVEINELIISNVNEVVGEQDTLYILGDLTMSNAENLRALMDMLQSVKCKNIQVLKGNHDSLHDLAILKGNKIINNWHTFKTITDTAFGIEIPVALSQYPILDYHSQVEPMLCLHGHSHGCLKPRPVDLFDVGVDVWNFKPVTLEQVLSAYYGDHANPYTNYVDQLRNYRIKYIQFMELECSSAHVPRETILPHCIIDYMESTNV